MVTLYIRGLVRQGGGESRWPLTLGEEIRPIGDRILEDLGQSSINFKIFRLIFRRFSWFEQSSAVLFQLKSVAGGLVLACFLSKDPLRNPDDSRKIWICEDETGSVNQLLLTVWTTQLFGLGNLNIFAVVKSLVRVFY